MILWKIKQFLDWLDDYDVYDEDDYLDFDDDENFDDFLKKIKI